MPASPQDVNRSQYPYCQRCGSYGGRTESDEIKELRGVIETKTAELRGRENTILKLQRDLQQAEAEKAEQERMYKHTERAAKLPEKPSRDAATSGTKNQESPQVLVESTTAAKRLEVQDTSQQSQKGVTMGTTTKEGFQKAESQNKGGVIGHIGEQIGERKRQPDEFTETTVKLNTKDSGVVDSHRTTAWKTRNHDLEEAFADLYSHVQRIHSSCGDEIERYREKASTERSKAESIHAKLKVWERHHSSCTGRITALETMNHDVEEAYEDLKSKYSHVQRIHSSCADQLVKLTEEASRVTALESRNHELQRELAITQEKYRDCKTEANTLKWDLEAARRTHSFDVQELQYHVQDQKQKAQSARQRADQLKYAFDELKQTHSSTTELLDARTKELTLAQQFLSTADSVAGVEVIRLVEKLNGEIMQCAAQLADTLPPSASNAEAMPADTNDQRITMAATEIRDLAGEPVIRLLQTARNTQGAATAVQIAVQACLVSFCERLVRFWHYTNDPQIERAFQDLYDVLRSTVTTPIAVKWRALTKSNLDKLRDRNLEQNFASQVVSHMLQNLSAIVLFTGYPGSVPGDLTNRLSSNLQSITKSVLELRTTIGEKALFCDLDMFLYSPGMPFDGNVMGNSFESGRQSHGRHANANAQPILCTTDLGLGAQSCARVRDWRYSLGQHLVFSVFP